MDSDNTMGLVYEYVFSVKLLGRNALLLLWRRCALRRISHVVFLSFLGFSFGPFLQSSHKIPLFQKGADFHRTPRQQHRTPLTVPFQRCANCHIALFSSHLKTVTQLLRTSILSCHVRDLTPVTRTLQHVFRL